jgi:hypothetical protein
MDIKIHRERKPNAPEHITDEEREREAFYYHY